MSITSIALSTPGGLTPTPRVASLMDQLARSRMALQEAGAQPLPAPPVPNTAQQLASVLNTLAKFIPGDILTIYLGIEAAIKSGYPLPSSNQIPAEAQKLAQFDFWFCFFFTIIWIFLLRFVSARAANSSFVPPIWAAVAGVAAFAMYACAVDTFWLNPPRLGPPNTVFIAIGVTLVTALLTLFNKVVGVAFPDQMIS